MSDIRNVIFDMGGVLVNWSRRHLYRKLFPNDEAGMDHFLDTVCSHDWHVRHDAGELHRDTVPELIRRHPEHEALIRAYDQRWEEMLAGDIPGTVEILRQLHARGLGLYGLTNWPGDKWHLVPQKYEWTTLLRGVVVSGHERLLKPDAAIYRLLLERYQLRANESVYIDDMPANVRGAQAVGMHGLIFTSPQALREDLTELGVL